MRHFLPKQSVQAILDSFAAIGLDVGSISDAFYGRGDANPEDWGVMASVDALLVLWEKARAQSDQPYLFVRAGLASPDASFGLIDHLVYKANTLEEGMHCLRQYITLVSSTSVLEFVEEEEYIEVQMINRPHLPIHDLVDQWLLGLFVQRLRSGLREDVKMHSLLLRPLEAPDPDLDVLLGAPVLPNPSYTGMRVAKEVWKTPLPEADPVLHQSLQRVADDLMYQQFSSAPLAFAVWNVLSDALQSSESISQAVASQLGVSARTLQRRLKKERFSLSNLLDAYRKQEALRLLSQGVDSIADIASRLGYSEQSSFNRSFKRWMGLSPRHWLKSTFIKRPFQDSDTPDDPE